MTTETGTLERTDTGSFAVVRVLDGHRPASSRDYMAEWDAIERAAAAEFAAWLEGQWAQIEAETRAAADEQLHQHRQVRVDIAERARREGTVNLPPAFEELPPVWAELPKVDDLLGIDPGWTGDLSTDEYIAQQRDKDFVQAYFDADDPDEMPGRTVVLTPTDHPLAQAYARTAHHLEQTQGWTPDPADYGPHRVTQAPGPAYDGNSRGSLAPDTSMPPPPQDSLPAEPDHGPIDRWLIRVETWWRTKQAQRDQRMGVGE